MSVDPSSSYALWPMIAETFKKIRLLVKEKEVPKTSNMLN